MIMILFGLILILGYGLREGSVFLSFMGMFKSN